MRHLVMQNEALPPPPPPPANSDANSQPSMAPLPPPVDANQAESHNMAAPTDMQESNLMERRGGWPKGRKRRRGPRDMNAPKQPLTGYVRYLNENREKVKNDNPGASFSDVTKLLAIEWSKLNVEEKQKYLEMAEKDKERYMKELEQYHQTEAYHLFKKQQEKRRRDYAAEEANAAYYNSNPAAAETMEEVNHDGDGPAFDIPIFTEEFLDHNKAREAELRQLRKSNTEYEEQNAILTKHIENMKSAIEKLEVETAQQKSTNCALKDHMEGLRTTLFNNFANIPLPNSDELPTMETIDSYMIKLHALLDHPEENELMIVKVKEVFRNIEYP